MKIISILFAKSLLLLISFFILEEILALVLPYIFQMFHPHEILGGFFRLIPEPIVGIAISAFILVIIEILLIQNFIEEQFNKTRITLYVLVALRQIIALIVIVYILYQN